MTVVNLCSIARNFYSSEHHKQNVHNNNHRYRKSIWCANSTSMTVLFILTSLIIRSIATENISTHFLHIHKKNLTCATHFLCGLFYFDLIFSHPKHDNLMTFVFSVVTHIILLRMSPSIALGTNACHKRYTLTMRIFVGPFNY